MLKTMSRFIAPLMLSLLLAACATSAGATSGGMTFTDTTGVTTTAEAPLFQSVTVGHVTGGGDTHPLLRSNVAPEEFKTALENSLRARARYSDAADAPYRLNAHLVSLEPFASGFDIWVTSTVRYELVDQHGQLVDERTIEARHRDSPGAGRMGAERQRHANEGSLRLNIQRYLNHLDWPQDGLAGARP